MRGITRFLIARAPVLAAGFALSSCVVPIPIIFPTPDRSAETPNPKQVRIAPATLTGMRGDEVVALLGAPDSRSGAPPDEIWEYRAATCIMDLNIHDARVAGSTEHPPEGEGACPDPGAPMRWHLFHPGPGQHGLEPIPVESSADQARTNLPD